MGGMDWSEAYRLERELDAARAELEKVKADMATMHPERVMAAVVAKLAASQERERRLRESLEICESKFKAQLGHPYPLGGANGELARQGLEVARAALTGGEKEGGGG